MNTWINTGLLVGMLMVACSCSRVVGAAQVKVDVNMLREGGDYFADEVLAWERLRAERQVLVAEDDSAPIVCQDSEGTIYAATASGKLLTSKDEGRTFAQPVAIAVEGTAISGVQAMGVLNSGVLVIAYGAAGKLSIASSGDQGKSWQGVSELQAEGYDGIEAGKGIDIVQLAEGSVLLPVVCWKGEDRRMMEGVIYGSTDEGKTWAKIGSLGKRCVAASTVNYLGSFS